MSNCIIQYPYYQYCNICGKYLAYLETHHCCYLSNYTKVGNCPVCGGPIYEFYRYGRHLPEISYSCSCRFNRIPISINIENKSTLAKKRSY